MMGTFGRGDDGEESRNAAAAFFGGQRTRPTRNICVLPVHGLFAALSFAGLVSLANDLVTGFFLINRDGLLLFP